jgi:RNA-directed DNA polymerase
MMNGYEKSDSVIVAAKPANKAAHSAVEQSTVELAAAEPVEPRAETKGNADQQSTCRAQSRVSVSQALERIRKVAKERKKERFTALFHHISIDLLDLRTQGGRRAGRGSTDVAGLRAKSGAQS